MSDNKETTKLQLKRDRHPTDQHTNFYHSRTILTTQPVEAGSAFQQVDNPVLQAVVEIPGVVMAAVTPYYIQVTKSPMYEWEEVEPQLLKLLGSFNIRLPAE